MIFLFSIYINDNKWVWESKSMFVNDYFSYPSPYACVCIINQLQTWPSLRGDGGLSCFASSSLVVVGMSWICILGCLFHSLGRCTLEIWLWRWDAITNHVRERWVFVKGQVSVSFCFYLFLHPTLSIFPTHHFNSVCFIGIKVQGRSD